MSSLPAYVANGGIHETAVPWPGGHSAGQLGILVTENDVSTIATPTDWLPIGAPVIFGGGNNAVLQCWYQFATSGSMGTAAISAANHCSGWISTFSGVSTGNPIHCRSSHYHPGSTEAYAPGFITKLPNCLTVHVWAWHIDNAGPLSSAETNSTLANLVERIDGGTVSANGGGIVLVTGEKATAGFVGPTGITFSSSTAAAVRSFALQSAGETFGHESRYNNTGM